MIRLNSHLNQVIPGLLLVFSFWACSKEKGSGNTDFIEISFALDTVMIDPGDEILNLRQSLWHADISKDGKYLFNYNINDAVMEKIDLDQQVLVSKIKFDKEGPEGLGNYISKFTIDDQDQFMFWYYGLSKVFDQNAKLVKDLKIDKILEGTFAQFDAQPIDFFKIPGDPHRLIGFYIKWEDKSYVIVDIDLQKESFHIIPLPELKRIQDFSTDLLYDGQWAGALGTGANSLANGERVLISNNCFNEVYIYDAVQDSLYLKELEGRLLGSKKTYIPPKQVDISSSQHWEVEKKQKEDINFGRILWDAKNQRYLRLSFKEKFGDEVIENRGYKAIGAEVFLSVFDKDFNLMAESVVPQLNKRAGQHFIKDGQIWIFENIDDEMAFLRLEILNR
ncbi:DUF4221 family protein [Cecembia calidifontis]|uniref:Uncharacterized protein DUF4221 n=1 Tax=Cecembia calidifontis TaxID=1187080 RepID=A0A4Q7P5Q3_9BACT|nr:DUF4221 family protein [Cecembia calidifontis]RZS95294.1 uncharacterized protein DUF4221 [Cecembia calidifontis]